MKIFNLFGNRTERRKSRRHGVIHTAWVRTATDPLPAVCVLWDVSDGGARLSVAQPEALPDTITITLKRDDAVGTVPHRVAQSGPDRYRVRDQRRSNPRFDQADSRPNALTFCSALKAIQLSICSESEEIADLRVVTNSVRFQR